MKAEYVSRLEDLNELTPIERAGLEEVSDRFQFLANKYYLSLVDWQDPDDPIRRIVVPCREELDDWGKLDASGEETYTVMPGLQHKYNSTALLLVSNACAGICRYCFRKRIFIGDPVEAVSDLEQAFRYIGQHREITNVLLTGGDPLMLPTSRLEEIIVRLRGIDHVRAIRIGTRMLPYDPFRILDDPPLVDMIERHSTQNKAIYVVSHFCHPRELTEFAKKAVFRLRSAGALVLNQTPILRGINDDPETLATLFNLLVSVGSAPYYVFQCRPALGNKPYAVPLEEAYVTFERAKSLVSGLAKRIRYVMSHFTGKIEIVGRTKEYTYFKYHRAARDEMSGRFMVFKRNPEAFWFDDYHEMVDSYQIAGDWETEPDQTECTAAG
ncbi:KamA family radical SAM protein [Thermodesulfobacteriota bacterium]